MFVLLLLFQCALGKDTSQDGYILTKIDTCPDIGYFFKRDLNTNTIEPSCHLCFCQDDGTAICWSRDTKRCNAKNYHHGGRKREARPRRSPGFSDIFFRDATRDIFNKQTPEQCKPFESSFSEGCPPADWCTGCTVCDCDANGRWDCHVLSFCPDDKGKKQMKKRKGTLRNKIKKRQLTTTKSIPKTTKKPTKNPVNKTNSMYKAKKLQIKQNKTKKINEKLRNNHQSKKVVQTKKTKPSYKLKNITKANNKFNKKGKSKKSINLKGDKIKYNQRKPTPKVSKPKHHSASLNNSTVQLAQIILKKVMASVEKIVSETQKNFNKTKPKTIQKRSMAKNYRKGFQKNYDSKNNNKIQAKIINKLNTKQWTKVSTKKANEKLIVNSRRKREIEFHETKKIMLPTTVSTVASNNYYRYTVDLKNYIITKDVNFIQTEKNDTEINPIKHKFEEISPQVDGKSFNSSQNNSTILLNNEEKFRMKSNSNITKDYIFKSTNCTENAVCGKFCNSNNAFMRIFGYFGKRNTKIGKAKVKNPDILDNLKKMFRKMFFKKPLDTKNPTIDDRVPFRKSNVIKTLCKNIEGCKFKHYSSEILFKINQLKTESNNILKSVRVIKGLLKLLDINERTDTFKRRQSTDDDMNKLNVILKDEYGAKYGIINLTDTQRTQIKYIKENTIVFIQSIDKFSYILQDILNILTNGKKRITLRKVCRCTRNQDTAEPNKTVNDKLAKMRKLLINYNLVQNKFMKKMYDILTTLEAKKKNVTDKVKVNEVSGRNESNNYTISIETYTKNIIKNLRKLKDLSEKLSSRKRNKRATVGDDNTIEYLLLLMEYLIKHNKPMDISPADDDIDLIIEAIKTAPDVKLMKKKVFVNTTEKTEASTNYRKNNNRDVNNFTNEIVDSNLITFESIGEEHDEVNKNLNNSSYINIFEEDVINNTDGINNEGKSQAENNSFDENILNVDKEDIKRYKIFTTDDDDDDDDDDDEASSDNTTSTIDVFTTTHSIPVRTSSPDQIKTLNNEVIGSEKMKLDWIEENFNEDREISKVLTETTTQVSPIVTRTINISDKYADPISSMSQETDDKRVNHPSGEAYKRQMNLLNIIDDGIDKTFSNSESKEEKFNVESVPLYFV